MAEQMFRDRGRAESFGRIAAQYDRARPPYPDALIVDLLARGAHDVLDVGCGTGKAARLLAARGANVLGVEIDEQMAEVARGHGLAVEVASFESWDDAGRRFDLVASAQAWHWVDPDRGARKAALVLRPGGSIALFWNINETDPELRADLDEVYRREAPHLLGTRQAHPGRPGRGDAYVPSLRAAGFRDIATRRYPWQHGYSCDEWLDLLQTYSDHHLLPDNRRERLLRGIADVIDEHGGTITSRYETHIVLARAGR